jgi:hypothetical protein
MDKKWTYKTYQEEIDSIQSLGFKVYITRRRIRLKVWEFTALMVLCGAIGWILG